MSQNAQSAHNAMMQANAATTAARVTAQATRDAARVQIEYDRSVEEARGARLAECIESFANLDESSLFRKSDKDLAHFQATYPVGSPQYALAINEWNRRLVTRQVNATKFSAYIGLAGVVMGVALGWGLSSLNSKEAPKQVVQQIAQTQVQDKASQQPDQKLQGKNPDSLPPKTASQPPPK